MACSFSGDGADKQAKELVMELRKRYKLPAYIYCRPLRSGRSHRPRLRQVRQSGKRGLLEVQGHKDKAKAKHPEIIEIAVLAGNYPAGRRRESPGDVDTLKYAKPQCLEIKEGRSPIKR